MATGFNKFPMWRAEIAGLSDTVDHYVDVIPNAATQLLWVRQTGITCRP